MKRSPFFTIKEIEGHIYLVPFGNAAASFSKDMEINRVGAYIWELLKDDMEADEVVEACMKEYNCPEEQYQKVKSVVEAFFDQLFENRLLEWSIKRKPLKTDASYKYEIAGLNLIVTADKKIDLSPMEGFLTKRLKNKSVLNINLCLKTSGDKFDKRKIEPGEVFVAENDVMELYKCFYGYRVEVKDCQFVERILINEKGDYALVEYKEGDLKTLSEELFLSMRLPFLYYAGKQGMIAIHSASVIYKNKGWLFSGKSQIGKSTHTNLWKKYVGTKIFNGDMNLLCEKDSLIYMHGIPWCGTSKIANTGCYKLAGITFLKQDKVNSVTEVKGSEKTMKIVRRLFSPAWNDTQNNLNIDIAHKIANTVSISELHCTVSKEAVDVMKQYIDNSGKNV